MKRFCGCVRFVFNRALAYQNEQYQADKKSLICYQHGKKDNRQTQAQFEYVQCGFIENADVVGAINVLKRGQAILATQ